MKVFLCLLLASAALVVNAGDKEMYMLKKWAMHKACESCFGEENTRMYMVQLKKNFAKCSGMPTPELGLPLFKAPYRAAGALVHNNFNPTHGDGISHHHHAHGHGDAHGHGHGHDHDSDWMENAMKKYFFKKMLKNMMESEFGDDDDDDMDSMDVGASNPMRFFKSQRRNRPQRYRRETSKEILDLGDKLTEKLEMEEEKMNAKIGNMTCMLRECGLIDASNNLNPADEIVAGLDEFVFPDPWLKERIVEDIRRCHLFATSIPDEVFEDCFYGPELGRVKAFKKCKKMSKLRTCMNFDIKKKLENNFAPLEDLVEETGLEEAHLFPLVMKMLHGPEMDM